MTTPQKDTPTSGGTAPDHESVEDHLRNLAHGNRARLLAKAALFASMHTKSTLWQRQMKSGSKTLSVRMEWPGVLCVYDPVTGEKLAESMPGQPNTLQK
jgi:hypothetical protein